MNFKSLGTSRQSLMPWLAMLVVLASVLVVRLHWLNVPLERDEGEYAYMGQLMLHGIPPYREAYNMKLPGTHASYAVIEAIFGQSVAGLRIGFLLVNLFTIGSVFWLGRKLFDVRVGLWSAAIYAVFSQSPAYLAPFGHATNFINLWVVPGVIVLVRARESGRLGHWFVAGTLFGVAVLMKQQALFLALFALGYTFLSGARLKAGKSAWPAILALSGGMIWPLVALCLVIWRNGDWSRFWYWVVEYGFVYASKSTLHDAWIDLIPTLSRFGYEIVLWALALLGVVTVIRTRRERTLVVGWFGAALLSTIPGFYFRDQYFIPLLPPVALLGAVALVSLEEELQRRFALSSQSSAVVARSIGALAMALVIVPRWSLLFMDAPDQISRRIYLGNVFPETREIGRYIGEHSKPDDRIAVLGSEPEIYFYANRRAATGYIYTYPLMEVQPLASAMSQEMAHEIEQKRPPLLVWVNIVASWAKRPGSDKSFLYWTVHYLANYHVEAVVEIWPNGPRTIYNPVQPYRPPTLNYLIVWRRNAAG